MAALCAKETFAVGVVDVAFGRIARLQGPPEKGPESAPKLPFHCEREIALTARNSRSTRGCGRVHAAADAGALGPLLPVLERTAYDIL
jgi:hypothetical protein